MKNKRAFIAIMLIVAVLLLAIGYAAISRNLTIGGTVTAEPNNENFKVHYSGATGTITSTKTGATLSATTDQNLTATINASGLDTVGQTVTATFNIINESDDLDANIAVATKEITGTNADYFELVSTTLGKNTLTAGGDTTTVTVVLRLKKTPTETVSGTVNVSLTATAAEKV